MCVDCVFASPWISNKMILANEPPSRGGSIIIEMARTMLDEYKTSDRFWTEAVNMTCHATNCIYFHNLLKKTSYELLLGNKPSVSYFQVFGSAMFFKRCQNFQNLLLKSMKVSC
jgi:hypothetical protein